jgi:hypothetical protein
METKTIEQKIQMERRKRHQAYTALDYHLSLTTYFDFFSFDTFQIAKESKYLTQLEKGKIVNSDILLLAFFSKHFKIAEVLNNFGMTKENIGEKISSKLTNQTVGEQMLKSGVNEVVKSYGGQVGTTSTSPITSSITNKIGTLQNTQNTTTTQSTNSKIDVGGKIEINVSAPAGVSTEQLKQAFDTAFNSNSFKDYITRVASPSESTKEPISKTYSA